MPASRPEKVGDHGDRDPAEPGSEAVRQALRLGVAAHPAILAALAHAHVAEPTVRFLPVQQRGQQRRQPRLDIGAPMAGQNERSFPVVIQYIDDKSYVVWPKSQAQREAVLPLPAGTTYSNK